MNAISAGERLVAANGFSEASARTIASALPDCDLAICLLPLLRSLGWTGNPRRVIEAVPHFVDQIDLTGFRNAMAFLGWNGRKERIQAAEIDERLTPFLYLPTGKPAIVALELSNGRARIFDSESESEKTIPLEGLVGEAWFFRPNDKETTRDGSWFAGVMRRFRSSLAKTMALSLAINLIGLAVPLFVMAIYDRIIGGGESRALIWLTAGACLALAIDAALRSIRSGMLAYVGARLNTIMGTSVFERILSLPAQYTGNATVGSQISRVKDFESIREFFTGPLAMATMDLPYAVVHLVIIGLLGGRLVLVPIVAYLVAAALILRLLGSARALSSVANKSAGARQEFLVESISRFRDVRSQGAETKWNERHRDISAEACVAGFEMAHASSSSGILANGLVSVAGVLTIWIGIGGVMDGSVSIGGLIASMMLVWKVLAPLASALPLVQRLAQMKAAIAQVDVLMRLPTETAAIDLAEKVGERGAISFSRTSLRHSPESDPALVGVSIDVAPGEIVALVGRNGAGKTTLLKTVLGLNVPQAGSVRVGGIDVRQLDPAELRHAIAYVPQIPELFHGTVVQNIRLGSPTASLSDIRQALELAGAWDEISALPEGPDTRILQTGIPSGLARKISLARAYVKRSSILLLDEPGGGLDVAGDAALIEAIHSMRGKTTVIMATHRPSHLDVADRIVVLDAGQVVLNGPAEQTRERIPKDMF
jgi:ATP-binding cassette subfamily C protein/ATP-binding cassette subfamily C protein LapB